MRQSLIIDSNVVDMYDEPVTLQYRSNMFGDLDSIASSNSLTIRLPATPRNNLVFGFANVPYSTGFERRWHDATYIRNGLPIIVGKVVLLSASGKEYEVSLVWGAFRWLQSVLESGNTLRSLPLGQELNLRQFNINIFAHAKGILYGYLWYNNGGARYAFPVVQVGWIFGIILVRELQGVVDTSGVDLTKLNDYYINFNEDLVGELVTDVRPEPSFPIKDYIPDIEIVEFVKSVCHLMGWYFEVSPATGLRLLDFSALQNSTALDWSDKLSSGRAPDSMSFDYNGYAQRNFMRYAEDDSVNINADGYVEVADVTLDPEKTLFTMPFAPTYGTLIQQYVVIEEEDGSSTVEFVKTKPRILKAVDGIALDENGDEIPGLVFGSDMYFERIIRDRYSEFQDAVRKPIVVTVKLRLNDIDLLNLDFSRKIYLRQYGSYFGVMEIQNDGDLSTAKLLKLS